MVAGRGHSSATLNFKVEESLWPLRKNTGWDNHFLSILWRYVCVWIVGGSVSTDKWWSARSSRWEMEKMSPVINDRLIFDWSLCYSDNQNWCEKVQQHKIKKYWQAMGIRRAKSKQVWHAIDVCASQLVNLLPQLEMQKALRPLTSLASHF